MEGIEPVKFRFTCVLVIAGAWGVAGCDYFSEPTPVTMGRPIQRRPKAKAPEEPAAPQTESDAAAVPKADPLVAIETSEGEVVVRLFRKNAPRTVESFLQHCDDGTYADTIFHQVMDGCIVLGGAFTADLAEKPAGHTIPNEADNGLKNRRGTIAMGRPLEHPNGATTQFFFNLADNPQFDFTAPTPEGYGYCVFGEVVSGMEVLERIAAGEVRTAGEFELLPVRTVMIQRARQLER